jgi:hypothetical protein
LGFEVADIAGIFMGNEAIPIDVEAVEGGEDLGDEIRRWG